jgi:hypothetical protein
MFYKTGTSTLLILVLLLVMVVSACTAYTTPPTSEQSTQDLPGTMAIKKNIPLPQPDLTGAMTLEETLGLPLRLLLPSARGSQ